MTIPPNDSNPLITHPNSIPNQERTDINFPVLTNTGKPAPLGSHTWKSVLEPYKCWAATWIPHEVKNGIVTFTFNPAAEPLFPAIEIFLPIIFNEEKLSELEKNRDQETGYILINLDGIISFSDDEGANALLTQLGFAARKDENDDVFLSVPVPAQLQAKWNELKNEFDLPELNLKLSSGISSDEDFIQAFIEGKIVISEDKEALHDFITHIIPLICLMKRVGRDEWNQESALRIDFINSLQEKITNCEDSTINKSLLLKSLGIFIDILTASTMRLTKELLFPNGKSNCENKNILMDNRLVFLNNFLRENVFTVEGWVNYILEKFPNTFALPDRPPSRGLLRTVALNTYLEETLPTAICQRIRNEWLKAIQNQ